MKRTQPKRNFTPIRLKDKAYGTERRRNFAKEILNNETEIPKPLDYEDIDNAFENFVKESVSMFNGEKFPVFTLYSNQRFSEYSQNWSHTDEDGNLLLNFITVNRDNNPKPGSNQGDLWNIPGERRYTINIKSVLDDNGTESYEIYSMKQPYSVDLSYRINFMTSTYDKINGFNNRINELFKARQCYIRPNGHFIPMIVEEINDETSYSIDERRFFLQSIDIKVMAYIINKEDFKVERRPKRVMLSVQGDKRRKVPTVNIEEYENSPYKNKLIDLEIDFEPYHERVEFNIDTDMRVSETVMNNIRNIRVFVNDIPYFIDKGFYLKDGDNVKVRIRTIDQTAPSKLLFKGFNPNEEYDSSLVNEDVSKEPIKQETITIE